MTLSLRCYCYWEKLSRHIEDSSEKVGSGLGSEVIPNRSRACFNSGLVELLRNGDSYYRSLMVLPLET